MMPLQFLDGLDAIVPDNGALPALASRQGSPVTAQVVEEPAIEPVPAAAAATEPAVAPAEEMGRKLPSMSKPLQDAIKTHDSAGACLDLVEFE
ncbi:hypothetical protein AURDEDRAFT_178774 [Auricularia subglabra TFB-10046 SS5]|uniref:Uncharacterized protein n=1 Tax=Auricularia subglabra (strain TFB-10046 / SS5) TaxID=717982 RepID=J0WKB4_AURST|nr:hypothetical protein AURDEDRAFT_178774 [Auricularia subglabra TFB-10046 SS5]